MPAVFISTNSSPVTGDAVTVASNSSVFILADVKRIALAGNGVSNGTGSRNTALRIDGLVMGDLAGVTFGGSSLTAAENNSVTVGVSGRVMANSGDGVAMFGNLGSVFNAGEIASLTHFGVSMNGLDIVLENNGLISGTSGVSMRGTTVHLLNTGTITATGVTGSAISVLNAVGSFIENSGTLISPDTAITGGTGADVVINRGVMHGVVSLLDGADNLNGAEGSALLANGGVGNDTLRGSAFDDTLQGSTDEDRVFSAADADLILGRDGDDVISGGNASDRLRGNAGDDVLNGNAGTDTLTGGLGQDVFVFSSLADMGGAIVSDRIVDFVSGTDQIDLSAIAGLTFIGGAAFTSVVDQARYAKGAGHLQIDHNGDGVADFFIQLTPGGVLLASDLIL